MKSVKLAVCGALAALALSAPAHAASLLFNFNPAGSTVGFTGLNPCVFNNACLSYQIVLPDGDFAIAESASQTFDFIKFTVSPGVGGDNSFNVNADLAFDAPDANPGGVSGPANYFRLGGIFTPGLLTGSLNWTNPIQQVAAADGSLFTLNFGNLSGFQVGGTAVVPVTITVDRVGGALAAVPEPATWAMMLAGFFGVGGMVRSRRRGLALAA